LDGYQLTDLTFTGYDILYKDLALSASIANLFNSQVVYPANMASLGNFGDRPAYQNDYPQVGREVSFSIRYDFK
jgi:outer membrane receptor protein involved in Fe transport